MYTYMIVYQVYTCMITTLKHVIHVHDDMFPSDGGKAQKMWNSLRNTRQGYIREAEKSEKGKQKLKKWRFTKKMKFLDDFRYEDRSVFIVTYKYMYL